MKNHTLTIPHLKNYRITFTAKPIKVGHNATTLHVEKGHIKVYVPHPIKRNSGMLVHELIHVVNYILEDMDALLNFEQEHMAYLAEWIYKEAMTMK